MSSDKPPTMIGHRYGETKSTFSNGSASVKHLPAMYHQELLKPSNVTFDDPDNIQSIPRENQYITP